MSEEGRRRWRDAWQLHLPLVVVLVMCTVFTIIEYRRAGEGVGRAWVYTFQWPIIGLFGIVIWNRYRKHGTLSGWFSRHYAERIARFQREDDARGADGPDAGTELADDPQEQAWRAYVASLQDGAPHDPSSPRPPA